MRCSFVIGAIWLALGSGAVALAPAADLALAPEAGVSPHPVSKRLSSHSVLKDLIAPSAAAYLTRADMLEAQLDRQPLTAPVPPPDVPTQLPQDAMAEGDDQAALNKGQAPSTLEPREAAALEANETEVEPAPNPHESCPPQGSARKFSMSPGTGGWHSIGKAHHYADCASAAASMGYKNVAWSTGSSCKGRCYGFASDVPEIAEHSCGDGQAISLAASSTADLYSRTLSEHDRFSECWLFGPTCEESSAESSGG